MPTNISLFWIKCWFLTNFNIKIQKNIAVLNISYIPFCWFSGVFFGGVARMFGAHGQQTLRGPSPYFITLFLWSLPHIHPYSEFTHVYLYYMILNTALFNQYISHGVFWKWVPLMTRWGKWGPLITWWEIRDHNGDTLTQWWIGTPW